MKILYMGTPEISAVCLMRLIDDGHNIAAVVTREDKPRGRGNVMTPTPTKALALERGIPVFEPKTLRDEAFSDLLHKIDPDIIVVVAYGKILPPAVLEYPKLGCINLHVSLLPKYRGAAPMQRAIMNGDSETGVTVMYMNEGLDTGDIISTLAFPIKPTDNFEDIHDRSAELGGALLSRTVTDIFEGRATRTAQDDSKATYAEKIEKADCKIDFSRHCREVDARIRATTPIPGAFAYLNGKMLKIFKAEPTSGVGEAGRVLSISGVGEGYFTVACGEGAIRVLGVIPEGKGRMSAGDFVRGRKISESDILE